MASTLDFRFLDEGLGGERAKRKRRLDDADANGDDSMDLDAGEEQQRPAKRPALASLSDPEKPAAFGQPTYDGVIAGRVSGRRWKQPRAQRFSAIVVSPKGKSLELRAKEKAVKRAYRERMTELKEQIRQNKVEKRKKREEREKRKQENILRSGTKLQVVSNPKTLKKIAKSKQRKQLKIVPDEVVGKKAASKRKELLGHE